MHLDRHVLVDGVRLAYRDRGDGAPVVVVHGTPSYSHEWRDVVPEVGINLGYQFTNHIRGFIGYNFLYWSNVVRPGNQIDQAVNPNLIPPSIPGGPSRPTFDFHGSDFWAQGINFGLDIRW